MNQQQSQVFHEQSKLKVKWTFGSKTKLLCNPKKKETILITHCLRQSCATLACTHINNTLLSIFHSHNVIAPLHPRPAMIVMPHTPGTPLDWKRKWLVYGNSMGPHTCHTCLRNNEGLAFPSTPAHNSLGLPSTCIPTLTHVPNLFKPEPHYPPTCL